MPTYKHGDTSKISEHFKACEFQCKCSGKHDFPLDTELVEKIEALYTRLNCSAINVSSGYRCVQHDKAVGGSGTGQHTLGKAADICCIGQDGKTIVSYLVCCAAQDVGFSGIARINDSYTHVDVRSGKWYGDETKGSNYCIPCSDFYEYYSVPKKGAESMANGTKGIDVSAYQGKIDWQKVKAAGIEFAILRAGLGKLATQKDARFEENYAGAKAAGIAVGAYWYSYAVTPEEAKQEAAACIEVLKGKQFDFPIFFDQEEKKTLDTGKANCSAMVQAFCDALEAAGYWAGLYTSRAFLQTHVDAYVKARYTLWVAEWGDKLNCTETVGIWQNSATGKVDGIGVDVDTDIAYRDFPELIKSKGLNGYGKKPDKPPETGTTSSTADSITVEMTVNGKKYSGTLKEVK